jgi:AraC-like DNA-binding protein
LPPITKVTSKNLKKLGFDLTFHKDYIHKNLRLHSVNHVLISIVMNGNRRHYLGQHSYEEQGMTASIIHYGQTHDIVTDDKGVDAYNIFLDMSRLPSFKASEKIQSVYSQILPLHPSLQFSLNRMIRIQLNNTSFFEKILHLMWVEINSQSESNIQQSISFLNIFITELCREASSQSIELSSTQLNKRIPDNIIKLREYLDLNYKKNLNIDSLAKQFNFSPSHLRKCFKEYSGKSIIEYIHHRRIQMAMFMLKDSHLKIIDICLECGFNEMSFFNKKFKSICGMNAREYRTSNQ